MLNNKLITLSLIIITSCAQVTGINLKKHQFSLKPDRIVWLQVPGLHEEHFAWIQFDPEEKVHPFNEFLCFGKTWNYTLKDLRHNSLVGLRVQDTGKKSLTGSCDDFSHRPLWSYLKEKGYDSGVLELDAPLKSSLSEAKACDKDEYIKDTFVWVSRDRLKESKRSFHADLKQDFKRGRVYFDKSCFKGKCVSNRIQNVERIYNWLKKQDDNHLFIIKDYGFENALKRKDFQAAKKILKELNLIAESFLSRSQEDDTLFMVTGTSSIGVELPAQGMDLKKFLDKGMKANYRKTMLLSPVLANGPRAENFCGIYEEVDLVKRIFSKPTQSEKKYIFINPFETF